MAKTFFYMGNERMGAYVEQRLAEIGWQRTEHAGAADAAITYCLTLPKLEDAYFEETGIVHALGTGGLAIDLSPASPSFSRELAAVAAVSDIRCVEAPIVFADQDGGDSAVGPSRISCFAAGETADVEQAMPILNALASSVELTGRAGTAQTAKVLRTVEDVAHLLGRIEREALARAIREKMPNDGWGIVADQASADAESGKHGESPASAQPAAGLYTVEVLVAEVGAALAAGDDVDLILPQLESCTRLVEVFAVIGGLDMTPAALSLAYCDEDEGAKAGLDWKRAQAFYGSEDDPYDEEWAEDPDFDHGYWDDGYDDGFDSLSRGGAFGGYSSN